MNHSAMVRRLRIPAVWSPQPERLSLLLLRALLVLVFLLLLVLLRGLCTAALAADTAEPFPAPIRTVLENTRPLENSRGTRLPLFVLPISQSLAGIPDDRTRSALRELDRRGIGYSVSWSPGLAGRSRHEALRVARIQADLGMIIAADATACLTSFFDGTDATSHVDTQGGPFAETSFGGTMGCPFTLEPRIPFIRERIEGFVRAYHEAGLSPGFVFADWEIDGPLEWNGAWESSKKCRRCRAALPDLDDFRRFQQRLRALRSELQRAAFSEPILSRFPRTLVGNYAVNPHDGYRYWYDYFETEAADHTPFRRDQRARYREWAHEFAGTGYTCALPVIYTWYPMFGWFDFEATDYRWFRPMLLEAESTGRHTPPSVPLIPFVHWHTTAPPDKPDPRTRQLSAAKYRELLAHLLLRGHDTFFLWCMPDELATEIRWVHDVYAQSLRYRDSLTHGTPLPFAVPEHPAPVISAVHWMDRVLAVRSDFGTNAPDVTLRLPSGGIVSVPARTGWQELEVKQDKAP